MPEDPHPDVRRQAASSLLIMDLDHDANKALQTLLKMMKLSGNSQYRLHLNIHDPILLIWWKRKEIPSEDSLFKLSKKLFMKPMILAFKRCSMPVVPRWLLDGWLAGTIQKAIPYEMTCCLMNGSIVSINQDCSNDYCIEMRNQKYENSQKNC